MRLKGAPRYHISTLLQTPPAFLVLSSHALCALGRFLICFQGNRLYLWFFFFARVCCSLIACRLRFAWTWTVFFFQNLHRFFGRKWIIFSSSCHHVASSWRNCYNWVFIGWKSVRCIFKLQSGHPTLSKNQSETLICFPMAKYAWKTMCWCQNFKYSIIR